MKHLPAIEIRWNHNDPLTYEQKKKWIEDLESSYREVMLTLEEKEIWNYDVEKVIVTDHYQEDVLAQGENWGVQVTLSAHKEYWGIAKALFNGDPEHPKWHLFFSMYILPSSPEWIWGVLTVFLTPYSQQILPENLRPYLTNRLPAYGFKHFVLNAISKICPEMQTQRLLNFIPDENRVLIQEQSLFNLFARKLKRKLYAYNASPDNDHLTLLWEGVYAAMYNLLLRSIDIYVRKGEVSFEDPVLNEIVNRILFEVSQITSSFVHDEAYHYAGFEQGLLDFLSHFRIELRETDREDAFYIHLDKNPKEYFKNLLVDTEPRIVCFMDILGFSQMIEEYEQNDASTVLQDIQKAFKTAITLLNYRAADPQSQEYLQYLEYKTFSDNICISLPYFDNETDFLSNLNLIITFVRGLQDALMTLGFFTRGGLTIGSYYSDEHMIFSKGMVDAYHLESTKAIYPRVLIADSVISKIKSYNPASVRFFKLESSIIKDRKAYCVYPFMSLTDTQQKISNLFDPAIYGDDDGNNPITIMLKTMTSSLGKLLQGELLDAVPNDHVHMQTIMGYVQHNKEKFQKDRRTWAKYLWLELLLNWKGGKGASKRFIYFSIT